MSARALLRRVAVLPIVAYRALVSPLMPPACIYSPTCSAYAQEAIVKHGILAGLVLAVSRVARCTALLFRGGDDPVPATFSFAAIAEAHRRFRRRRVRDPGRDTELRPSDSRGRMQSEEGEPPHEGE